MTIEELYKKYYAQLFYTAVDMVKTTEAAQDIIHTVFYNIIKNKYDYNERIICKSVKNACLNYIRDKRVVTNQIPEDINEDYIEIRFELILALHKSIEMLPKKSRKIMKMFVRGASIADVCAAMKTENKTIRNQKSSAIAKLREIFKKSGINDIEMM